MLGAPAAQVCAKQGCRGIDGRRTRTNGAWSTRGARVREGEIQRYVRAGGDHDEELAWDSMLGKGEAADSSEGLLGVSALVDEQWIQLTTARDDCAAVLWWTGAW